MKPQSAAVLRLLRSQGQDGLTQQRAIRDLACYRLAARVADLRADGFTIRSETAHGFARYFLVEAPVQEAMW